MKTLAALMLGLFLTAGIGTSSFANTSKNCCTNMVKCDDKGKCSKDKTCKDKCENKGKKGCCKDKNAPKS